MITIIITEKPSVAKAYQKVLQISDRNQGGYYEGYSPKLNCDVVVTWAVGHLIGICSPEKQNSEWKGSWYENKSKLPMIPDTFKYEPLPNTAEQFSIIKSLYTRDDVERIYYAGDSGREGIYIQALIRNQIFRKKPDIDERVVWISSTSEQAILDGISNAKPYSDYQSMIDSGYARAIADWLIGMNFTMAFTITSGGKGSVIKTGRVMTPTLAMIVDRQSEIDSFVKTDFYGIKAEPQVTAQSGAGMSFIQKANVANSNVVNFMWKSVEGSRYFDTPHLFNENGLKEKEKAESLLAELNQDKKLTVSDVKTQTKTEYAPLLFNLADLQSYCSKAFKISVAKVLEIAQELYEPQYSMTTYPRTDSRYLDTNTQKEYAKMGYNVPNRYVNDKKVQDHFAIIPTFSGKVEPSALPDLHRKVYDAILKRFLDTMKDPFIYDTISVAYKHSNGEFFFDSFRKIKQKGFKETEEDKNADRRIPEKNETIPVNFSLRPMETTPPPVFTESTIISAMEKAGKLIEDEELREQIKTCGIGTSATRAGIIEKLKATKLIETGKNMSLIPTDFGKSIIPIIRKYDETLVSPLKTADLEMKLSDIADGEITIEQFRETLDSYVTETTHTILKENHTSVANGNSDVKPHDCPCCSEQLKYGKFGWYCNCGFNFSLEVAGHKMKEKDLEDIISKGRTKFCTFKSKKGNDFKACLVLDKAEKKCNFEFEDNGVKESGQHNCPCCNSVLKTGRYGWYCDCKFSFGSEIAGHKMTEKDLEDVIKNGRTKVLKFKSKAGKDFNASLVLDKKEKKCNFEFENKK